MDPNRQQMPGTFLSWFPHLSINCLPTLTVLLSRKATAAFGLSEAF
jgi:hypothetical protein